MARRRGALLHVCVTRAIDPRSLAGLVEDIARLTSKSASRVIELDLRDAGIHTPVQACVVGAALSWLPAVPLAVILPRFGATLTAQIARPAPAEHFETPAEADPAIRAYLKES